IASMSQPSSAITFQRPTDGGSAVAQRTSISQSQTTDITIITAEGDKVTLSSSVAAQIDYATYNAQGRVGGNLAGFQIQRDSSLTIEGDLSPAELKDIRKAIKTIQKATHDLASGDAGKTAQRTARLGGLDTIAELDAEISMSQTVSVQ